MIDFVSCFQCIPEGNKWISMVYSSPQYFYQFVVQSYFFNMSM